MRSLQRGEGKLGRGLASLVGSILEVFQDGVAHLLREQALCWRIDSPSQHHVEIGGRHPETERIIPRRNCSVQKVQRSLPV